MAEAKPVTDCFAHLVRRVVAEVSVGKHLLRVAAGNLREEGVENQWGGMGLSSEHIGGITNGFLDI